MVRSDQGATCGTGLFACVLAALVRILFVFTLFFVVLPALTSLIVVFLELVVLLLLELVVVVLELVVILVIVLELVAVRLVVQLLVDLLDLVIVLAVATPLNACVDVELVRSPARPGVTRARAAPRRRSRAAVHDQPDEHDEDAEAKHPEAARTIGEPREPALVHRTGPRRRDVRRANDPVVDRRTLC